MKVLVITRNAWDDSNAIGNTISNFFQSIDNIEFASIYFRSSTPNNKLCSNYFRTSEIEVLRNWFRPSRIGKHVLLKHGEKCESGKVLLRNEKKIIHIIQKYGVKLAYFVSDYLWYSEKWINKNLDDFILAFSPDVVFTFAKSAPQYYLTVKYLREKYDIPVFSWIADDEYSALHDNNSLREIHNLKYILDESSVVKGCSEEVCGYYNSVFSCDATPQYKGCVLTEPIKEKTNDPIRIVYAGNLLYGRLEIICEIAEIIEGHISEEQKIIFEIYSNTNLLKTEINKCFDDKPHTKYMGRKEYSEVTEILSKADVVLHVESFDKSQILKTKYSFSTKIIDYLQSGSVILAVGPMAVASIKYISRIPGAHVVQDLGQLRSGIDSLLKDSENFAQRAKDIRAFAQKKHDASINSKELEQALNAIITRRE